MLMLKSQHILTYQLRFVIEIGVCVNVATLKKGSAREQQQVFYLCCENSKDY